MNLLRSCSGCSAHLLTNDGRSQYVWCPKCRLRHVKPWDEWAAGIAAGSLVYVQPIVAWRGLSHSQYVVLDRDGDTLTAQVLGLPQSRITFHVNQTGQYDLTPRPLTGGGPL